MSGDTFNSYGGGDQVAMNGGTGNIGIVKGGQPLSTQEAVEALRRELERLRGTLAPDAARTVDDNLPVVADGARPAAQRRAASWPSPAPSRHSARRRHRYGT
ncbi:hypothetical protein [Streptomyces sp. NPDC058335]|uniref:hypothetical protein n=1 Tax=Streptomyces sp. NPDC058335 TaxID=3346451 RepID=UPI003657BE28